MSDFDYLLKKFDLEFFGTGRHKISIEAAVELFSKNEAVIVDVRSAEETKYVRFDFAGNIPVADMPDKVKELPGDKTIIVFCSSVVRAAIVYAYLKTKGFADVRILAERLSDIAESFKPGYVRKLTQENKTR